MPIRIKYKNVKFKDEECFVSTLNVIEKDVSWGTWDSDFRALSKIKFDGDYKQYEAEIGQKVTVAQNGCFELTLKDEQFNLKTEGIDHLIATVAGGILLHPNLEQIVVDEIFFDGQQYNDFFRGPNVGIDGIYKLLEKTTKKVSRPILAYSVKPRIGLSASDYAKIYSMAQRAKVDIIEDDERLVDPTYCPFKERVIQMGNMQKKGHTKYSVNITGPLDKMKERLDMAYNAGLRFVKVDVMTTGFDALKSIADYIRNQYNGEVAITCYPDAMGLYRNLSKKIILQLVRLCGADIVYVGSPRWARRNGNPNQHEVSKTNMHDIQQKYKLYKMLRDPSIAGIGSTKSVLPTMSNSCDIYYSELMQKIFKHEFSDFYEYGLFVGGGISAYPQSLGTAIKEWRKCLEYTAKQDKNNMENFKYSEETIRMQEQKNLKMYDLKKEILGNDY